MKVTKITKGYTRTISQDYQTFVFTGQMEAEIGDDENASSAAGNLFDAVKTSIDSDVATYEPDIRRILQLISENRNKPNPERKFV